MKPDECEPDHRDKSSEVSLKRFLQGLELAHLQELTQNTLIYIFITFKVHFSSLINDANTIYKIEVHL